MIGSAGRTVRSGVDLLERIDAAAYNTPVI